MIEVWDSCEATANSTLYIYQQFGVDLSAYGGEEKSPYPFPSKQKSHWLPFRALSSIRLLGKFAVVRRWCGRRSRGAELLEKGAAPPEGAGGGVRGARTHKSGALPADAGASRRGPPWRIGGHRGGRRSLGSATPARRVHASIGAGSPPSHRGWAAGGPYGVRRGRALVERNHFPGRPGRRGVTCYVPN